ncbi:thioredoxin family protein [Geothrix sp. PMB-07]|uniref:thioredoxin family protein n=1 Tax=Geothrix sp. PMB-07 TaxID=3068640 RepID=UPI002740698C|nr:thioredoxin family protein [Geothrix sp. PMB-07]WLT33448.1 thioredoxin family protein [Geothrix sp. PMB-07]
MPRPATLPVIDWKAIFDSGLGYQAWLDAAESGDQRDKIEAQRLALNLDKPVAAYLAALPRPVHVVAIAEDWCGDVVRHAPVLERMAEAGPALKVRYISREQHPHVFVRFLTNGGEAIPKFIFLSERFVECGSWGPMPERCKELIARGKACGDVAAARKKVSGLYELDSTRREVVEELLHLVEVAVSPEP